MARTVDPESFEVEELDDKDLEGVAGGNEEGGGDNNKNCGCGCNPFSGGSGNENCGCCGSAD